MTLTLFFIMILSLGKGAVEAGGIPMWHEPGAAAGHYNLLIETKLADMI